MRQVKELWQHDLNAILGQNGVEYPWYILGDANMLDVAHRAVNVCKTTRMYEIKNCFSMVTLRVLKFYKLLMKSTKLMWKNLLIYTMPSGCVRGFGM